jgi:hypothetical protein
MSIRAIANRADYMGRGRRFTKSKLTEPVDVSDIIPRIVEPELWEAVQERLRHGRSTRKNWSDQPAVGPLHGARVLFCGNCGHPLSINRRGEGRVHLRCRRQGGSACLPFISAPFGAVQAAVNDAMLAIAVQEIDVRMTDHLAKQEDDRLAADIARTETGINRLRAGIEGAAERVVRYAGNELLSRPLEFAILKAGKEKEVLERHLMSLLDERGALGRGRKAAEESTDWLKRQARLKAVAAWTDEEWRECYRRVGLRVNVYNDGRIEMFSVIRVGGVPVIDFKSGASWRVPIYATR